MKIKSLILTMVACAALFTACSNEDDIINKGGDDQKFENPAYANFAFAVPGGSFTKATGGAEGDGNEEGSSAENNITSVNIYLFNGETLSQTITLDRTAFTPNFEGGATLYKTKKAQLVAAASYHVYVVVNPSTGFTAGATLTSLKEAVLSVAKTTGAYCTDNNFMMTNANLEITSDVTLTDQNTETNPASVTVAVERIAAKVDFQAAHENTYQIKNEAGEEGFGSVKFDAYKIINTRNSAFGLRRVQDANLTDDITIGGAESPISGFNTNYVIENLFTQKTSWDESVFTPNYSRKYTDYVAFRKLNTQNGPQALAYCLENTMPASSQINGYSTGIILRAKVTLAEGKYTGTINENGDLYRFAKKFYASLTDLDAAFPGDDVIGLKAATAGLEGDDYKTAADAHLAKVNNRKTLYDNFGVEYFIGGYCYYTYWLRHSDNGDAEASGVMEFAIVRNNIYRMSINSVAYVGDFTSGTPGAPNPEKPEEGQEDVDPSKPNPEIPGEVAPTPEPTDPVVPIDPTNPDESTNTYLDVVVKVKNWIIRDNGMDL